jgi:hypothetical protein
VSLAQRHEAGREDMPGRVMSVATKRAVRDRYDSRKHVLDAVLEFRGEKILALGVLLEKLGRAPFFRDVSGDRQQM